MCTVYLGLDIGGANLKAVALSYSDGKTRIVGSIRRYHPIWIRGIESLKLELENIKRELVDTSSRYAVGVTMTAELSDIFRTKTEGVETITKLVESIYSDATARYYVTVDGSLVEAEKVLLDPIKVAAANWAASGWLLERECSRLNLGNILFIDIGSTTTTIIPIVNCRVRVRGYTDPEKLVYGELVYTGILRGNVATVVDRVPYKGYYARVSSERFALMGDVHLVLGYISNKEYTTETADGRGTSLEEAVARLSRLPCADQNMLGFREIVEIARYIYEKQIERIFDALMQIRSWLVSQNIDLDTFTVVTAGIGEYLAVEACKRAGFTKAISIDEILSAEIAGVLPAYASALMVAEKISGARRP
ncbi:MAG: H4MPT-linked C1 transfer pathway protein [Thermoprotei archaeon]|nr:MAG: H4MPT-linked C1 transfer pathway protein [Thermoprotei archaeon]